MIIRFNTYINENIYDNVSFDTISSLVKNDMITVIKDYLDNGGNINLTSPISNETLLMSSLKSDNSDIFDLILSYNPDLTLKTKYNGSTILFYIIKDYIPLYKKGFIDIIKKVLEKDITILEIEDNIGSSPVEFAALHSSYALFELLKFKPNLRDCSFFDNISDGVIETIQRTFKDQYNYCLKKRKSKKFNL